jgi:hypothetical protein
LATELIAIEAFRTVTASIRGLPVSRPWKGYGSAIFLELGQMTNDPLGRERHDRGEVSIKAEWDWRVEAKGCVLYGSSNSRPKIANGIAGLQDKTITDLIVEGEVPELVVTFDNGQVLRTMAMVGGDPQWSVGLHSGAHLYARRGSLFLGDGCREISETESTAFEAAERAATRWARPLVQPIAGQCSECRWFVPLDGEGHLLDYGACIASSGPLDGRIVNRGSGCPVFVLA